MAGSRAPFRIVPSDDPAVTTPLDGMHLLADGVRERVLVLGRDLTIRYANKAALDAMPDKIRESGSVTCYEACLARAEACSPCLATQALHSGEVRVFSVPQNNAPVCGLKEVFPLVSSEGNTTAVMAILAGIDKAQGHGFLGARSETDGPNSSRNQGELIGQSQPMRHLFEMIRLVADSYATVLIQGESGTGKELVARTVHRLSPRRERPFVVVDCGTLPQTLLESELFGHVKGAFTGAAAAKKGLFQVAAGGTLFLDEIGDTTPQFQAKLLRVLQEGEIKPVGGTRPIQVDVRIISASNKDLFELVKAKAFREDLYYRLAVLPLLLPPLRDRREDIPLLVRHFVAVTCARQRRPICTVSDDAMHRLTATSWPGNVRQLKHLIERAIVTAQHTTLRSRDFFGTTSDVANDDLRSVARNAVRAAERTRILEVLRQTAGSRVRAARLLGISRATLYNKLRSYGIEVTE